VNRLSQKGTAFSFSFCSGIFKFPMQKNTASQPGGVAALSSEYGKMSLADYGGGWNSGSVNNCKNLTRGKKVIFQRTGFSQETYYPAGTG